MNVSFGWFKSFLTKKSPAWAAVFFCATVTASAQSYSIDWYKVAGGGGDSAGGNFSLSGTIGQADAGTMAGGNYSLTGGFWSLTAVQTPGSPVLNITVSGQNAVLSWLDNGGAFRLQHSTNMTVSQGWFGVSGVLTTNAGVISSTQAFSPVQRQYFRLIAP